MTITSRDVARLAGVSQPTVSRALRGDARVSAATRERVTRAADALGYVPSEAGRSLVTRRTRRIGTVVTDLANPFYPHLVGPLHDELERHGYRMMMFAERSDSKVATERLLDGSLDGVVLMTSKIDSMLPAELTRRGLPYVFLNRESGDGRGDAAVVDNHLGGRLAADLVAGLGHRHIGGIFGPQDTTTGRERELGFRLALAEHGLAVQAGAVRHGPFDFAAGHALLAEVLAATPRPTAVFCGSDAIAIGALNAALGAGLRVPEDLTVIGFDDIPMASWEAFRLTTVSHDLVEMAAGAARLLIGRIETEEARDEGEGPRRVVSVPRLVERGTHAGPPR
ncbi:LacI family DNA-binding transcriptional regulator [Streptomyces tsukubensis]|nr:LacI family DNA-binding transcriptional regulator [Streptomyces tsukubensis]QFR96656.1 LacI family DNA-binding transcriptional regulator [Streptomyces tsukubensis]